MLTSLSVLQSALERYNKSREKKEKFSNEDDQNISKVGFGVGIEFGLLVLAIIFFALELLVMFFAINIAVKCTSSGAERIVHVVLAIAYTFPYMVLNVLFNKCALENLNSLQVPSTHSLVNPSVGNANIPSGHERVPLANMSFCGNIPANKVN